MSREPYHWVAHRGDVSAYAENSLEAISSAWRAGLAVECDVQIDHHGKPVLLHDPNLIRTHQKTQTIFEPHPHQLETLDELLTLERFLSNTGISPKLFLEVKHDSIRHWGATYVADVLCQLISPPTQICLLAREIDFLALMRRRGYQTIALNVRALDEVSLQQVKELQPDYLVIRDSRINAPLWQGPWQWMAYEVRSLEQAQQLARQGVKWMISFQAVPFASGTHTL